MADPDLELIELPIAHPEEMPERRLWAAVMRQLLDDGKTYWLQKGQRMLQTEYEAAFDDLVRCGPMTRHVCKWLDVPPWRISEAFIRKCEAENG
ncbi:hypothetical protein [Marinobacter sp.]|uniref:hypothetical protein n=1 Tax=Marinobacter sp. TaxID=50741 RepID=UPI003A8E89AB